jgi:hypothetical protein
MTAEEFYLKKTGWKSLNTFEEFDHPEDVVKYMIEFAKYHVEQALKEALSKSETYMDGSCVFNEFENSILNAYPLENIK